MEQTIDSFYRDYSKDIKFCIDSINGSMDLICSIYLKNINKRNELGMLCGAVIAELKCKKEEYNNDLTRIATRNKANTGLVRWH